MADAFFDSNVILYLLSSEREKADRSEQLLAKGGAVSVQVLNECFSVARRKLGRSLADIDTLLALVRAQCEIVPLTLAIHLRGRFLHERYKLGVFDAMIVAAALQAGATTLYSEDMQNGLIIDGLAIRNPYRS